MLDLGHNRQARVPAALGSLAALTDFLYLHGNRLTALPEALGRLTRLRELHLRGNRLATLPEAIGELPELRHLDLRRASGRSSGSPGGGARAPASLRRTPRRGRFTSFTSPTSPHSRSGVCSAVAQIARAAVDDDQSLSIHLAARVGAVARAVPGGLGPPRPAGGRPLGAARRTAAAPPGARRRLTAPRASHPSRRKGLRSRHHLGAAGDAPSDDGGQRPAAPGAVALRRAAVDSPR